jgi:hypothetical protein
MAGTSLRQLQKRLDQQCNKLLMWQCKSLLTGGVGREPKVVGNAFALDANKLSAQLKEIQVCML